MINCTQAPASTPVQNITPQVKATQPQIAPVTTSSIPPQTQPQTAFKALYIKNPKSIPQKILDSIKNSVGINKLAKDKDVEVKHMRLYDDTKNAYNDYVTFDVRKIQDNVKANANKSNIVSSELIKGEDKFFKNRAPEFSEDSVVNKIQQKFDLPEIEKQMRNVLQEIKAKVVKNFDMQNASKKDWDNLGKKIDDMNFRDWPGQFGPEF